MKQKLRGIIKVVFWQIDLDEDRYLLYLKDFLIGMYPNMKNSKK